MRGLLDRQVERDSRLGEFLLRTGLIDAGELRGMRALQAELIAAEKGGIGTRLRGMAAQRFRLGRLLVDSGVIDEETLREALARSRRTGRRLGESLVEGGDISTQLLERFLARQRKVAGVAVASAALSALAAAPAGAGGHSVHITVAATVMVRVSIEWERLPRELVITPQDIERGYVEVDAVEIGVRSNNPAGVRIRFVARSAHFSDVDVEGRGPAIFIPQVGRGLQRQSVRVRLKLKLAPGTVPGTITYPVSVSVTPA